MKPKSLVPDSFMLAGIKWKVIKAKHLTDLGNCEMETATVYLRDGLDEQIEEATFCHELVHAIQFSMGLDGTKHDEREVDAFGLLLHQYLTTRT